MKLRDWLNSGKGRATALAKHLDVSKARISQIAGDDGVPRQHMRAVFSFTGGDVSYEEMLPVETLPSHPIQNDAPAGQGSANA